MSASEHRTRVSRLPEVRAVAWSCTCGAAQVMDYGMSVTEAFAVDIAFGRADRHRRIASQSDERR